jgi:hypothetical protein
MLRLPGCASYLTPKVCRVVPQAAHVCLVLACSSGFPCLGVALANHDFRKAFLRGAYPHAFGVLFIWNLVDWPPLIDLLCSGSNHAGLSSPAWSKS